MLHRRACNLCEAICGLIIETDHTTIRHIAGDPDDPLSKGYLCPKAFALKDIYEDPNRLKTPLKKTADGWQAIGWEEALEEVAERLRTIQQQYGNNAVGAYHGNPSVHNLGTMLNSTALTKALRSQNTFSASSADQVPHHYASWVMFGHPLLLPVPDISRTHFMLILGGNPMASNGSMMTAPGVGKHLKNIQQRGGRVVVVDPRRTETAEQANQHIFICPATDVFFLLSILSVLFEKKWINIDKKRPEKPLLVSGLAALEQAVADFTPEKMAAVTHIPAAVVRQVAEDFVAAPSAVIYGRMGVSTQRYGSLCQWLINCINIVTGNFDTPGGAMFTRPAIDVLAGAKPRPVFGRWKSRVRGLPEFMGELPVSTMAEEILTPGEGQIRALLTSCGNPVLSTPNGGQLERALEQLDFMVSIDIYLNETTRHADIILPPATGLETGHYDLTFNLLAIRNTAKYSPPTLPKSAEARYDYEIFQELVHRFTQSEAPFAAVSPEFFVDQGLQFGPYQLTLDQLKAHPEGIDLGELQPCLPDRLIHADKTIPLVSDTYLEGLDALKAVLSAAATGSEQTDYPYTLTGRRNLRDNNSWMHNSEKLMKGRNRCTLLLHPDDARTLGIAAQQMVFVASRTGQIQLEAEISDEMMPGVVSIPHGYGHHRAGIQLDVATQYSGVSVNDLTDELEIDTLTGNAAFSNVRVRISTDIF
jgi:anaerobic selenocysteine-containing dehydrogenase